MPGRQFLTQFEKEQTIKKKYAAPQYPMSKNLEPMQKSIFLMEASE